MLSYRIIKQFYNKALTTKEDEFWSKAYEPRYVISNNVAFWQV